MLAILTQPNRTLRLRALHMPALVIHGLADKMVHVSRRSRHRVGDPGRRAAAHRRHGPRPAQPTSTTPSSRASAASRIGPQHWRDPVGVMRSARSGDRHLDVAAPPRSLGSLSVLPKRVTGDYTCDLSTQMNGGADDSTIFAASTNEATATVGGSSRSADPCVLEFSRAARAVTPANRSSSGTSTRTAADRTRWRRTAPPTTTPSPPRCCRRRRTSSASSWPAASPRETRPST